MSTPAGARRWRVTVFAPRRVEAPAGDRVEFDELMKVWASRDPILDGERVRARQLGGEITDRFVMPWCEALDGLSASYELECRGARYGVTGVKPVGYLRALEVTAVAQADTVLDEEDL